MKKSVNVLSFLLALALAPASQVLATPPNDDCADALVIGTGTFSENTDTATADGSAALSDCSDIQSSEDVWYSFTPTESCVLRAETCGGASWDTAVSIHTGCPGTTANELACNDDNCSVQSRVSVIAQPGQDYKIRVGGYLGASGPFNLTVTCSPASGTGLDIQAAAMSQFIQFGRVGDIVSGVFDSTMCNAGDEEIEILVNPNTDHPFLTFNAYRLKDDRFEQIGRSWAKHTWGSSNEDACGLGCQSPGTETRIGIGCSDTYRVGANSLQSAFGPRSEINPWTGEFVYQGSHIDTHAGGHDAIEHLLQLHDVDLDPVLNAGAEYFTEFYVVANSDVEHMNNLSWEALDVVGSPGGTWLFDLEGPNAQVGPALDAWSGAVKTVIPENPAGDGRCILAAKVTDNGDGTWHYEYALYNLDLDRKVRSFRVPVLPTTTLTNVGFDAVESTDIYSNDPWPWARDAESVEWSTEPFATNPTANPLRWGTLYNFRFDADVPPVDSAAILGIYEPGSPLALSGATRAPASDNLVPCAVSDGEICDDGDGCTTGETCFSGICLGTSVPPQEVSPIGSPEALLFLDRTSLTWEQLPASCATSFVLYRGLIGDLALGDYGCPLQSDIATNGTTIGSNLPVTGTGWSYLVTGTNTVGEGPLGLDSSGVARANGSCP